MQKTNRTKKATSRYRKDSKRKQRQKSIRISEKREANHVTRSRSRFYPVVPAGFYSIDNASIREHDYEFMVDVLKPSYVNYCKLSECDCVVLYGHPTQDLRAMTEHLASIVDTQYKGTNLRIQKTDNSYQWEIYSHINAAKDNTIYMFSLVHFEKINFFSKYFSRIFEKFMASMFHKMNINYYCDNYRFDALLREIDQEENYDDSEEGRMQWHSDMSCYLKFAPLYVKRMSRVGDLFKDSSFKNELIELKEHGNNELYELKHWMVEGFDILSNLEQQSINSFQYDNEVAEDYNDDHAPFDSVKLEDLFIVSWDCNDQISYQYIEWINGDSGEYGSFSPCEWMILTPNTNQVFKHSYWAETFFTWLDKGFKIFNQLESDQ